MCKMLACFMPHISYFGGENTRPLLHQTELSVMLVKRRILKSQMSRSPTSEQES